MKVTVTVDLDECRRHTLPLTAFGPVSEQPLPPAAAGATMLGVLSDSQQGVVTYGGPVDKKGNPAPIEGLTFVSTDETAAKFVAGVPDPTTGVIGPDPANDGKIRGTVVGVANGVCRVRIEADADMGDGKKPVFGEYVDIQVTGGEATGFGSPTFGSPTDQP